MKWDKILLINRVFLDDVFLSTIEVIFFSMYLGLNFSKFSIIMSTCLLVSLICQIPTGMLADYIGRKKVLLYAKSIDVILVLLLLLLPLYIKTHLFYYVLIIQSMNAAIGALSSGNFEVLIFESFKASQENDQVFIEKSSKYFSIGAILSAIFGFVATIFFSYWAGLPLLIDIIIKMIKLVSLPFLNDARAPQHERFNLTKIMTIKFNKSLILTIIFFAVLFAISRSTFSLYQPMMTTQDIPLFYYGILMMIINLMVFILSGAVKKLINKVTINNLYLISIMTLLSQAAILCVQYPKNTVIKFIVFSIVLSMMQIIRLFSEGMASYFINREMTDARHKTLTFSLYSMLFQILLSLLFFIMGYLETTQLAYLYIYSMIIFMGIVVIGILYLFRIKYDFDSYTTD